MLHIENGKVVRARVDGATACFFERSHRIVVVSDKGDFDAAQLALDELRKHIQSEQRKGETR